MMRQLHRKTKTKTQVWRQQLPPHLCRFNIWFHCHIRSVQLGRTQRNVVSVTQNVSPARHINASWKIQCSQLQQPDQEIRRSHLHRRERKPDKEGERNEMPPTTTKLMSITHHACIVKFPTTSHVLPGGSVASAADGHVPSVHALEKRTVLFVEYVCKISIIILCTYSANK